MRNGITASDISRLKHAVNSKSVYIPASVTLFEETISILRESEDRYDQHINVVLDLIDKRKMVKPYNDLLRDECYNYAAGQPPTIKTIKTPPNLLKILDISRNSKNLNKIAEDVPLTVES
ncbi:MAG TPA: hypothetical protein VFC63_26230 [Blastocatellia bacterium]|nr:hypothetical protein [Blastocatellia bacterium]